MSNRATKSGVPAKYDPNRLPNGHFKKGNMAHHEGGEAGKKFKELRSLWYSTTTPEEFTAVKAELVKLCQTAKSEDVKYRAIMYYVDRFLGRPRETIEMDVVTSAVQPAPVMKLSEEEQAVIDKLVARTAEDVIDAEFVILDDLEGQ